MVASREQFIRWWLKCLTGIDSNRISPAEKLVVRKHADLFAETGSLPEHSYRGLAAIYRRAQSAQFIGAQPVIHHQAAVNTKTGLPATRQFVYPDSMYRRDEAMRS